MSELQITVNSRTLERLVFVFLVVLLLGANIWQFSRDKGSNEVTGRVTTPVDTSATAPATTTATTPQAPKATCFDGIKNQDETQTDCEGVCGTYWYEDGCHKEPKAAAPEAECKFNSDCKTGFACEEQKCVEEPPECTTNDECAALEECKSGKCVEKELSGELSVNVVDATLKAGAGNDTKKVIDVKLSIENGKTKSIVLYGKAFVYEDKSDDFYNLGKQFEIGTIKGGETSEKYYAITNPSFQDDGENRYIRVEIYDENDEKQSVDGTLTKKIYP
jgi:hypothetical protein